MQIDRRLRERRSERSVNQFRPTWVLPKVPSATSSVGQSLQVPAASALDTSEPMQLGLLRPSLTPEERQRRRVNNLCMYCGESGHYVRSCPNKTRKSLSATSKIAPALPNLANHLALSITLQLPGQDLLTPVIIDSGACSCFIDLTFATQHRIPLRTKSQGLAVYLADGSTLSSGPVTLETIPLLATMNTCHQEFLRLDAFLHHSSLLF